MNRNTTRPSVMGSSLKPPGALSGIPLPSTIKRPQINSQIPRALSTKLTTTKKPLSTISQIGTANKRPASMLPPPTTVGKFARATGVPLTLKKTGQKLSGSSLSGLPLNVDQQRDSFGIRLDFHDTFTSPTLARSEVKQVDAGQDMPQQHQPTPVKIVKEVECRATSPLFSWDVVNQESELISLKAKNSLLEKQVADLQARQKNAKIEQETKEFRLKAEIGDLRRQLVEKSNALTKMTESHTKLHDELEELKVANIERNAQIEAEQTKLEAQIVELKEKAEHATAGELDAKTKLEHEKLQLNHCISQLEAETQQVQQELNVYKEVVQELEAKQSEETALKTQLAEAESKVRSLGDEIESYKEGQQLASLLQSEMAQFKHVQEENAHLRQQVELLRGVHSDNAVLKEQLLGKDSEIESLRTIISQKAVDAGELKLATARLEEWTRLVGIDSPEAVKTKLAELEAALTLLRVENESLKSEAKMAEAANVSADLGDKATDRELAELRKKYELIVDKLKKMMRKCLVITKERDNYKQVITTLQSEATVDLGDANQRRINNLEKTLEDYRKVLQEIEVDLKVAQTAQEKLPEVEKELELVKLELDAIRKANPNIFTTTVSATTSSASASLQTPEQAYRVLHLADNPLALRVREYCAEHERMASDIERFKCMVELLESNNVTDMTRQLDEGLQYRQEVERLQKNLEYHEAEHRKTIEGFAKTSRHFRLACQRLLGYRLDNHANCKFRAQHLYADNVHESLEFIISHDGKSIKLVPNDTAESLQDLVKLYLVEHNDFPAFMAAYTLKLFSSKTLI